MKLLASEKSKRNNFWIFYYYYLIVWKTARLGFPQNVLNMLLKMRFFMARACNAMYSMLM